MLSDIGKEEPQAALSVFTKGVRRRWTYMQRTIKGISEYFRPLEEVITNTFIPAIIGREVSAIERRILALPCRFGGIGIQDPTRTADIEYYASKKITEDLTNLIFDQNQSLEALDGIKQNTLLQLKKIRRRKTKFSH